MANTNAPLGIPRPSIFEVVTQEALAHGMRKGIKFVVNILYENNPDQYGPLKRYFEEWYTLFDFVVQFIHLKGHAASFAEHFYGMRRLSVDVPHLLNILPLGRRDFFLSLVAIVAVPYIREKLQARFENIRELDDQGAFDNESKTSLFSKLYLKAYPFLNMGMELCNGAYQIGFALGKVPYHSPLLHLLNLQLGSIPSGSLIESSEGKELGRWSLPDSRIYRGFASVMTGGLSLWAFVLQFLDWYYGRESTPPFLSPFPMPPPPPQFPVEWMPKTCPICKNTLNEETVLSSSGFVFCYGCIHQHLLKHMRCPVTGYPGTVQQLIRLYPYGF